MSKRNCNSNNRIICDPEYIYTDTYVEREFEVVHPIIRVNREHIVNVPRHVYREEKRNEIIDPGYPSSREKCKFCNRKKNNR